MPRRPEFRFAWWTGPIEQQELFDCRDRAWLHRMWALTGQPIGWLESPIWQADQDEETR